MSKRVLHLRGSSAFLGAEHVVLELARQSHRYGFEAVIGIPLESDQPEPELVRFAEQEDIRVQRLPCKGRFDAGLARRLQRCVRQNAIDLIHSHGYKEDFYALLARSGVPLVATNHLWKRSTWALRSYAKIDGYVLRHFDHTVAVSQPIYQEMLAAGIAPEKLSKIPNGIDPNRFEPARGNQTR
ncbi:glycosyltransferase family 4 protein [Alkalilimnicola ehrlichii]|uniref:Glycosyltransferase subfamily 4-like N-terminal domain-containing protein n=1 Tax=Alkalilimnicola ehrlichii TaxID=351052 RepID=A0A3E0WGL0_9GAMM|nr:glycosyltransferase family 4 protein [Alkalilimnicola ehrlichii]RFA32102.1 hypothetical protein CAL65_20420 [Alkalilimnicola ehrlichii]